MATLYRNFLAGTITDNPLLIGATTINSANFANLPAVAAPNFMWLVLDPDASAGAPEIVKVTAHTASATSLTATRAQQSTTARQHASGTTWRVAATQTDLEAFYSAKSVFTKNSALVGAGVTVIPWWDVVVQDDDDWDDLGTNPNLLCPATGVYAISAFVDFTGEIGGSGYAQLCVHQATGDIYNVIATLALTDNATFYYTGGGAFWIEAGQVVRVRIFNGSASSRNYTAKICLKRLH